MSEDIGSEGTSEDLTAWNLVQTVALAQVTGRLDAELMAGIARQAIDQSNVDALVTALSGHGAILLRLYARAAGRELIDVIDDYGDLGTLARLDVELDPGDQS
jgi:hypothetical protein